MALTTLFVSCLVWTAIRAASLPQWPLLIPSPAATSTLLLNPDTKALYHAQGALNRYYCYTASDQPPSADHPCNASMVLLSSNPIFELSLTAVDLGGNLVPVWTKPTILANDSVARVDSRAIDRSFEGGEGQRYLMSDFAVEVLKSEIPIPVEVCIARSCRSITLMHDNVAPSVKNQKRNVTASHRRKFVAEIRFRDPVYRSVGTGCDPVLGRFFPKDVVLPMGLRLSTAIEASTVCSRAISEERNLRPEHFVAVTSNIDPHSLSGRLDKRRTTLKIEGRLKKKTKTKLHPETPGEQEEGEPIEITVLSSTLMDAAGNQLMENATYSGTVYRMNEGSGTDEVGYVGSTTLMAASVAVAVSGLVPSSSYGAGLTATPGIGPSVEMAALGQKLYFMGSIARGEMPENFQSVTDAFSWCALNVKTLWEPQAAEDEGDDSDEQMEAMTKMLNAAETIEMFSYNNKIDPYIALGRVLFIAGILHSTVLLMRPPLITLLKLLQFPLPALIVFPRLELFLGFWTVPAISAACARLLTHSRNGLILGGVLLISVPGMFLVVLAAVLHVGFFKSRPTEWRVRMIPTDVSRSPTPSIERPPELTPVLQIDNKHPTSDVDIVEGRSSTLEIQVKSISHEETSIPAPYEEINNTSLTKGCWFVRLLVGGPIGKSKWVSQDEEDKFLQRFGPIFEDYRIRPRHRRSQNGSSVAMATVSALQGITLATAVFDCLKRIVLAMICVTDVDVMPLALLIPAALITIGYLIFLRLCRPFRSRWRLGMAMLIELSDAVTFSMGAVSVTAGKNGLFHQRCGLIMICTQGAAYCLMLAEKLLPSLQKGSRFVYSYVIGWRHR